MPAAADDAMAGHDDGAGTAALGRATHLRQRLGHRHGRARRRRRDRPSRAVAGLHGSPRRQRKQANTGLSGPYGEFALFQQVVLVPDAMRRCQLSFSVRWGVSFEAGGLTLWQWLRSQQYAFKSQVLGGTLTRMLSSDCQCTLSCDHRQVRP